MAKRFAYFYFMKNAPEQVRQVAPAHAEYWKKHGLKDYQGGPFADKTGGLISFQAADLEEATELVGKDPFVMEDILEKKWMKEWIVG